MSKDFDIDNAVQSDAKKIREMSRGDVGLPSGGALLENVLWGLSITCVLGMVVSLPWVGADKLIPGAVWLGFSLSTIFLFGAAAMAVRWARSGANQVDRQMDRRFEARR